jgi:hypothetical protein
MWTTYSVEALQSVGLPMDKVQYESRTECIKQSLTISSPIQRRNRCLCTKFTKTFPAINPTTLNSVFTKDLFKHTAPFIRHRNRLTHAVYRLDYRNTCYKKSHAHFLLSRKLACEITKLFECLPLPTFKLTDRYSRNFVLTLCHPNPVISNFLQLVITTWRNHEHVTWQLH